MRSIFSLHFTRAFLLRCTIAIALLSTGHLSNGQVFQWAKNTKGTSSVSTAYSVVTDDATNVYSAGYFTGTIDFDPNSGVSNHTSAGTQDICISKLDSMGNYVWSKSIGAEGSEIAYTMAYSSSGYIYVAGTFNDTVDFDPGPGVFTLNHNGSGKGFILKLDLSGNFVWAIQSSYIKSSSNLTLEGAWISVDASGDVIYGAANHLVKYSSSGTLLWDKTLAGSIGAISADASGNCYASGYFSGTADFDPGPGTFNLTVVASGNNSNYIVKLNSAGDFVHAVRFSDASSFDERITSITTDVSGNILVAGVFMGNTDFDPGATTANVSAYMDAVHTFILKLTSALSFSWVRTIIAVDEARGSTPYSIVTDVSGGVFISGSYSLSAFGPGTSFPTLDLAPGPETYIVSDVGTNKNVFILKLNQSGDYIWANAFSGSGNDVGYGMHIGQSGAIYTTGFFTSAAGIDFDPAPASQTILTGSGSAFVLKYFDCGLNITQHPVNQNISIGNTAAFVVSANIGSPLATYQWQKRTGLSNSYIDIEAHDSVVYAGFNNDTLIVNGNSLSLDSTHFRCIVRQGSCATTSNSALMRVTGVAGGSVSGGSTICGGTPSGLLTLSGHGGSVVKWQSSTTPFTAWSDIAHSGTTYTSGPLSQKTAFRAVVQSGSYSAFSSPAYVDIKPGVWAGDVAVLNDYTCGGSPVSIRLQNFTGTITKWQSNTNGGGWVDIADTAVIPTFPLSATAQVRAEVTSCGLSLTSPVNKFVHIIPSGTWSGRGGNSFWNNPANWCGGVPNENTDARTEYNPIGGTLVRVDPNSSVRNLVVGGGTNVSFATTNSSLKVTGQITFDSENGPGTFNPSSGTVSFEGTSLQNIPAGDYGTLIMNNAAGGELKGNVFITTNLTLTSGKILLGNYDLTIRSAASITGGDVNSFIVTNGTGRLIIQNMGPGGKSGHILFPVGTTAASYTPVIIRNSGPSRDAFNVRVLDSLSNSYTSGGLPNGTNYTSNAVNKAWVVKAATGTNVTASITFQWNGSDELPGFDNTNATPYIFNGLPNPLNVVSLTGSDPYQLTIGTTIFHPFGIRSAAAPAPSVGGSVNGGGTVCAGSPAPPLTLSNHIGTVIKWQSAVSPYTTWTDIAHTATTYSPGILGVNTAFRAVVQNGGAPLANSAYTIVYVSSSGSAVVFNNGTEVIPGGTYCNLTISGGGQKILGGPVTITGQLIFGTGGGYIELNQHNLTIDAGASITGAGPFAHIVTSRGGSLIQRNIGAGGRTGNILFPVGSHAFDYTPVTVENTGTPDEISVQILNHINSSYNGNIPTGTSYITKFVNKTWLINEGTPGGSNINMKLEWPLSSELSRFDRSNLAVFEYDGPGRAIFSGSASGTNPFSVTLNGITSLKPLGIGNAAPNGNYQNVVVNDPAGLSLTGNMIITGSITLTNGLVYLNNYDLTVSPGASIVGGNASSYFVTNGSGRLIIQNIGPAGRSGAVVYPAGADALSYTPVTITNTGTTDNFALRLLNFQNSSYNGVNPTGTTYTSDAVAQTWIITEETNGGSNLNVTMTWNAVDELTGFTSGNAMIVGYNGAGSLITSGSGVSRSMQVAGLTSLVPMGIRNNTLTPPSINTVIVNDPAGLTLTSDLTITGSLILINGMLNLGHYNLVIAPGATITGGSASSFIVTSGATLGKVIYQNVGIGGNTGNIVFPVGTAGSYSPITIRNFGTADNFTVKVLNHLNSSYNGTNPTGTTYSANAVAKTWLIEEAVPGGSDLSGTLQWNGTDELVSFTRNSMMALYYNGAASLLSTGSSGGSDPYTYNFSGLTQVYPLGLRTNMPLMIARSNASGLNIAGTGSVQSGLSAGAAGTGVKTIADNRQVTIYPNPFTQSFNIRFDETFGNEVQVMLVDMTGRTIVEKMVSGKEETSINGGDLKAGIYILRIVYENQVRNIRLVKE